MYYMPVLRVRKVGNSLGVVFPRELVNAKGLRLDDDVIIEIDKAPTLASVLGSFTETDLSVDELNELANEGEDL